MTRFENLEELANKVAWEGGLEAAFDYGITSEMLPEEETELKALWEEAEGAYSEFSYVLGQIYDKYEEFQI